MREVYRAGGGRFPPLRRRAGDGTRRWRRRLDVDDGEDLQFATTG